MMIRQAGGAKQSTIYLIGKMLNNSRETREAIQNAAATYKIALDAKIEKDKKKAEAEAEMANIHEIALEVAQNAEKVVLNMKLDDDREI